MAMKNWKTILIAFVSVILVWLFGYLVGRSNSRSEVTKVETEVVVKRDTIREYIPVEIAVERTEKVLVEVRDTIRLLDTLYVALPFEKKFYKDEDYYAEVSGYRPSLDYIEVYPKTTTVYKTQTVTKTPAVTFSLDLGLDYGVSGGQKMLIPNVGASLAIKRLTLCAEAGFEVGKVVQPYYTAGVRFSLTQGMFR